MMLKLTKLLLAIFLLCCQQVAFAKLTCTAPVSTGFATAYAPTGVVPNVTQGTVTFNCTRTKANDDTSVLLRANNGANNSGVQNRAKGTGTNMLNYEAYKDSACASVWTSTVSADYMTVPLVNVTGAQSVSVSYWGCITQASQNKPAGTYTDTVTMGIRNIANNKNLSNNGTFTVSITNPASCVITTSPGDIVFNYVAFSAVDVTESSTMVVNCTQNLPYTMSLDANSGVVSGLRYTLDINSEPPPVDSRGAGAGQNHTINATMQAGQAGTCGAAVCVGSSPHVLTIMY